MFSKSRKMKKIIGLILTRKFHSRLIDIHPEVQNALYERLPLVTLESTILTHGMPYPNNVKTAIDVENLVRKEGAVPATIGIINGKIKVGLDNDMLEQLGNPKYKSKTIKTSRRDFPYVLSQKLNGGTTVSGTILVSSLVNIPLFVTGGIGGVHYDGENSMDISADLIELSRNSVTTVCAGIKSILDIGRTLEYLETHGVSVISFSSSKLFPSFYTRFSEFEAPYNVNNVKDAAKLMKVVHELNLNSGILIGVPIPEQDELANAEELKLTISKCLQESHQQNIKGKYITPYILNKVNELTEGKSLKSNIGLIKNNAQVGSQIAIEFNKLAKSIPR